MDEHGQRWEGSHDEPCAECGATPCYVLWHGDALCAACVIVRQKVMEFKLSMEELRERTKKYPPPQSWYDEDMGGLC